MLRHTSPISGIASYSDKLIATAGYDNRAILWCAKTKTPIAVGHHDHLANQCEFSSCGKYLVTASSDHTARVWSVPEMKLLAVLSAHQDDVESTAIHPAKHLIATASRDNKVRIFDFTGQLLKVLEGHKADVISVQWSGDSNILLSSSDDGTIRVWDIEKEIEITQLNNSGIQTDALAITKDGAAFAGDDSGHIHLISKTTKITIPAHQAGIKKLVYNDQLKKIISVGYDRKACLWSVISNESLKLDAEFNLPHIVWPRSCAFHADTKIVFATFGDSYAIYDLKDHQWELSHIKDTRGVNAILAKNADIWTVGDAGVLKRNQKKIMRLPSLCNFIINCGEMILTGGQTGEVFDGMTGKVIYRHKSPLNCAACFEFEGFNYVVIGTYTGEGIVLQQDINGVLIFIKTIPLHENAIKGLAINNDILFSVCATGSAAWYNLKNNKVLNVISDAHSKISNGCVALENNVFASISRDLKLRIWKDESLFLEINTPFTHSIKCITTDPGFRYVAMGSYNGVISVYDRDTSYWLTQKISAAGISSICFDSINGKFLAASYDGNVYSVNEMPE